ncbi:hypothetical protein AB0H63_10655 [Micromonospora echinospora]|uniref:hypothetical protein n=1 Tax=Micromonospora echinospora TaxID=1877 RepID=UPI0033F5CE3E
MVDPKTKLRPRDISALPKTITGDDITTLLTRDWETFCTCVVAEATRWTPPVLRHVLRTATWRDDWIDALTGAEATLQIAVMRARYEEGLHAERTRTNVQALAKVRARLHQARASAPRRQPPARPDQDPAIRAATKALIRAHHVEFNDLVVATFKAAGVDPDARQIPTGGSDVIARWALQLDPPIPGVPPLTDRVRQIAAMPDDALDSLVALDIQRAPEEPELCHPLLLDRWGEALERLAQATADLLELPHRPMATIADADLTVAGLAPEEAYRRMNRLRFLAHLQQRWLEQKTLARRFRQHVTWWRDSMSSPLFEAARQELRDLHRDEFEQLLLQEARTEPKAVNPAPQANLALPAEAVSPPQAALVLADRLTELGWDARVVRHVDADSGRAEARVDARRGGASLRAAYTRKNKGRTGKGWFLVFAGVRLAGDSPVRLPKTADVVDLAALPHEEFVRRVAEYRVLLAPAVSRG